MNCKPSDLAVIVSGKMNIGRFVTVLSPSEPHGPGWWYVEMCGGPAPGTWIGSEAPGFGRTGHIEDRRLRPIRPDSITTEEVNELYQPSPVKEREGV